MNPSTPDPLRVVIAGGGVGALETALALRALAWRSLTIELVAPERHFVYRPVSVSEPFGLGRTIRWELAAIAHDRGFGLVRDAVERVDADGHRVLTQGGATIEYDVLVLSLGARPRLTVPGALCFRGPQDAIAVREALLALEPRARVGYVVDGGSTWPLPAYELALMTEYWSREERRDLDVVLVTSEPAPLGLFGTSAGARVGRLLAERGIEAHVGTAAGHFSGRALHVEGDMPIPLDAAIALPALTGPAVPGVPHDALGFAPVDEHGRVRGISDVYAVGDMADHPLKQGGLAAQQGDIAAHAIAARLHRDQPPPPPQPILRALLFTGEAPLWLRNPPGPPDPRPEHDPFSLWWPPHKIVGAHLAPYLQVNGHLAHASEPAPPAVAA